MIQVAGYAEMGAVANLLAADPEMKVVRVSRQHNLVSAVEGGKC